MGASTPGAFDVYVISLGNTVPPAIARVFPEARLFSGIDLRNADPLELLRDGVITESAYESISRGRKYHHEFSGVGGVGLYVGVRKLLNAGNGPVLVMEEDCMPSPDAPAAARGMLKRAESFDMAVLGPLLVESALPAKQDVHPNFGWLSGYFWGMHAVLYTSQGRRLVRDTLAGPCDLQIDGKLSRASVYMGLQPDICLPVIRTLVQTSGPPLAQQLTHQSTIQTKDCPACDVYPTITRTAVVYESGGALKMALFLTALTVAAAAVAIALHRTSWEKSANTGKRSGNVF